MMIGTVLSKLGYVSMIIGPTIAFVSFKIGMIYFNDDLNRNVQTWLCFNDDWNRNRTCSV